MWHKSPLRQVYVNDLALGSSFSILWNLFSFRAKFVFLFNILGWLIKCLRLFLFLSSFLLQISNVNLIIWRLAFGLSRVRSSLKDLFDFQSWRSPCTPSSRSSGRSWTSWPWRTWRWGARHLSSSRRSTLRPRLSSPCKDSLSTTSPWGSLMLGKPCS